ncbi:MAG: dTDP-4-amino-4,6-dideoxygalactose transaminase [Clostridia bacterium]|jgi:dTDP-4-amino-4,6-dideoxygalactose transaminase|nr:dTDP-4-amino-4,6-dideoxygalactose transaminase [Clostridia bacterium]
MIPYHKIYKSDEEENYICDALARRQISGDGYYTKLVEDFLQKCFHLNKVLMTTSATHALELAMLLIDLKSGDEVIMPSFTFSSTANAVLLRGAKPVFAEIDKQTLNLDPQSVHSRITKKTRAIIPVHYAGISCNMDALMDLAKNQKIYVIEDAAQAVNAKYRGKYLGGIGHMGCYSFHGTKNFTSGEGGALIINREDEQLIERAECIRQKGTDRSKFLRGEIDSYSWVDTGSSYSPSELLMALLYSQLQELNYITQQRRHIHAYYSNLLQPFADKGLMSITQLPEQCEGNYHIYYMVFHDKQHREYVMKKLLDSNIGASTHFVPLHSSEMGRKLGYKAEDLPITEQISKCILRLPIYPDLKKSELDYIAEKLTAILEEL